MEKRVTLRKRLPKLKEQQIRQLRLWANCLDPVRAATNVSGLVHGICGIQAQDRAAAELAVQPRSRDLTIAGVRHALEVERSIVRTWAMRGTIHFLATEDMGWMLPLLGPVFIGKGRRRLRALGIDEETRARAMKAVRAILSDHGALTRGELTGKLATKGIPVDGQAGYHLIHHAALEGVVCFGADRDGEHTFVLVDDWIKMDLVALEAEEAVSRLVRRYLHAFGPAGPHDFASWSGLGMGETRAGFESNMDLLLEIEGVEPSIYLLEEQAAWLDEPDAEEVVARLLPAYDPFLLGYRSRAMIVPEKFRKRVHPGGGVIRATVLIKGRAAGTWRWRAKRQEIVVTVEPFEPLSAAARQTVEREIDDLRRFLGEP